MQIKNGCVLKCSGHGDTAMWGSIPDGQRFAVCLHSSLLNHFQSNLMQKKATSVRKETFKNVSDTPLVHSVY